MAEKQQTFKFVLIEEKMENQSYCTYIGHSQHNCLEQSEKDQN